MNQFLKALLVAGVAALAFVGQSLHGAEPSSQGVDFFEKRIRPVLAENCFPCHSAQAEKLKATLRLDSRDSLLKGGDSGPAAVPGDPDASLLIKAVRYADPDLQMPPKKGKLPDRQIDDLAAWIKMGIPWPAESALAATTKKRVFEITSNDRTYWAFQPVGRPTLPSVRQQSWVANGIDAFVLARLEANGLNPNPPATRRELVRRVYFDLLGLPPSPSDVATFLEDPEPDAYERLVDRLLARPEYGERWARHWLDVARYAQSNGYERDGEKPLAWRYRDYVINALNEDKPYDRFIQEQVAGDELPDATADSVAATGFQRLGVWDDEPDDQTMAEYDGLDDIVSTTGTAFLGLTLGCARCHDHKFDPISQADYYQFLSFFRNVRPNENARYTLDSSNYLPLVAPEHVRQWLFEHNSRMEALESQVACATEGPDKADLQRQLRQVKDEKPPFEWTLGVCERGTEPMPTRVLIRGNPNSPGPEVEPAFLTVLGGQKPAITPSRTSNSTGRRLALARWIANSSNPLTPRVAVNRVWHHHFGQGIVKTTADFGRAGTPPTNPALLDWLAAEFINDGWSLKKLHRLILLSNTYQMSSRSVNNQALALDPGDDLLWRQRLRRLEAESVRDAILSVSGELNPALGGRGFFPRLDAEVLAGESRPGADWEISSASELARRSIYIYIRRTMLVPFLEAFDYSNTSTPLGERPETTVAPQSLMLLNADWTQQRASAFARRLANEAGQDPRQRVQRAYQLALGRAPYPPETKLAVDFVERQHASVAAMISRLTFRPEVPNSLFADYMKQLEPADFVHGPRVGWSYYRGRWSGGYEGIRTVDRQRGPFALWTVQSTEDGVVEGSLLLHAAAESGSILLRAKADGDELRGYEIAFDPRQQRVALRRHGGDVKTLAERAVDLPLGKPLSIRISLAGPRLRVWTISPAWPTATGAGSSALEPIFITNARTNDLVEPAFGHPVLDVTDPKPILGVGYLGVRCAGAALSADSLVLHTSSGVFRISENRSAEDGLTSAHSGSGDLAAWQRFCLLLLNLNEFLYVD